MKRVIIAGGTGFLGRAFAQAAPQNEYELIALTRQPDKAKNLPNGMRAVQWDGRTAEGWGDLANGAYALVNFAGASIGMPPIPWSAERKRKIRESRVNAGHAIVAAVQATTEKPRVVIQASAVGYYGSRGVQVITEETSAGNDFLARVCVDWESSTAETWSLGVRRVVIRTGLPLSKTDGVFPMLALPFKFFVGGPLGSGKQYVPWIHLADHIAAIHFLIDHAALRGAFNLSAPNPVTNAEFGRALGKAIKRPAWLPVPEIALKLALGEMADRLLLTSQRMMPTRLQQAGFKFKFPDVEPALRDALK
ncbi:MAG: TIGR01777 family protein [Chloroflexi bacterium]|nr:TIGR01777 family protein [Chloroflexota bacterium]